MMIKQDFSFGRPLFFLYTPLMSRKISILILISLFSFACATHPKTINTAQAPVKEEPPQLIEEPQIRVMVSHRRHRQLVTLPLDTYLTGVIGNEMSAKWPVEALKAQTVAARSYALYRINQARSTGRKFDVVPTQADQVFRKKDASNPYLKSIVDQTRGIILWNNGNVVEAFYSSTCGGQTRAAIEAGFSKDSPLNKVCTDDYCLLSPFRDWAMTLSRRDLEKRFRRHGRTYNGLRSIEVLERDPSGYVKSVEIVDAKGIHQITGNQFRKLMGAMSLKSLLFTISEDGKSIYFNGHGFGHGVGLCQFGAKEMALDGKDYRSILKKYYPGIALEKIYVN